MSLDSTFYPVCFWVLVIAIIHDHVIAVWSMINRNDWKFMGNDFVFKLSQWSLLEKEWAITDKIKYIEIYKIAS